MCITFSSPVQRRDGIQECRIRGDRKQTDGRTEPPLFLKTSYFGSPVPTWGSIIFTGQADGLEPCTELTATENPPELILLPRKTPIIGESFVGQQENFTSWDASGNSRCFCPLTCAATPELRGGSRRGGREACGSCRDSQRSDES